MELIKKYFQKIFDAEKLYFIPFIIYLFQVFIESTNINIPVFNFYLHWFGILSVVILLPLKIYLIDNYTVKQYVLITIILMLNSLVFLTTNSGLVLLFPLLIIGAKGISFKRIIEVYFYISLTLLLLIMSFSLLNIVENLKYVTYNRPNRFSMGILYPTDFAAHVLSLMLAYWYLKSEELQWFNLLVMFIISLFVFKITDARFNFVLSCLMLIFACFNKLLHIELKEKVLAFGWILPTFLSGLLTIFTIFYSSKNHILLKLDELLSGRLYYSNLGYSKFGVTLFGQKIKEYGNGGVRGMKVFNGTSSHQYFFIDSSYVRLLIVYGILMTVLVVFFMSVAYLRSYINHEYIVCLILIIVFISGVVEQHVVEMLYNPFLIVLMANFSNRSLYRNEVK